MRKVLVMRSLSGKWLVWPLVAGCASLTLLAAVSLLHADESAVRPSRFFMVDMKDKKVVGPAAQVQGSLQLKLISVTTDQPQYWPPETVHLKVVIPGRPGGDVVASWRKRDANAQELNGKLDDNGVAVLSIMDGSKARLELGEYRVDVRTKDNAFQGSATFAVVEGTLGGLSLAHEFKQVTSVDELDKVKGGWFMGNAAGAGKRWGNGLSFKNELRVDNKPYNGEITYVSRCMLPGCNGVEAGRSQKATVKDGLVFGTMEVGGHSGPFQIEFITSKGSLRHQFEGSSHVERDMVMVSGGVSWLHRAGLAPYEKTVQVPGRQIFLEKNRTGDDVFEIESIIATGNTITVKANQLVQQPALHVWSPQPDGTFKIAPRTLGKELKKGESIEVAVGMPYAFVAVGGFVDGRFKEGWTLAFAPTGMQLALESAPAGGPGKEPPVQISARSLSGEGLAVSAILEVFDNRVASRSPSSPLASVMGDAIRNLASAVNYWEDRTGIDERKKIDEMSDEAAKRQEKEEQAPPMAAMAPPPPPSAPKPSIRLGASAKMLSVARSPSIAPGSSASMKMEDEPEEPTEPIREGEKKVVYCGVVRTDATGKAVVNVTLPPQLGRVSMRLTAIKGLDHATTQSSVDVTKKASVEARVPRLIVPGAKLQIPVYVVNTGTEPLKLTITGAGMDQAPRAIEPGSKELMLEWTAAPGPLSLVLADKKGKPVDRREFSVQSLGAQTVTFSRLLMASDAPVSMAAGETAMVYEGPGALLKGIVMNMVTTMESWFGHAEALSAQAAARAVILSAISKGVLTSEGMDHTLAMGLDKVVRHLNETFFDPAEGLMRPYPGVPVSPLWTAWVSRNLHVVVRVLSADPKLATSHAQALITAKDLVARMDDSLKRRGLSTAEMGGYDEQGRDVIPVELNGQVVYRVVTDDAVSRWAVDKLLPLVGSDKANQELDVSRAYDTFRFLRAFERVGMLQYLTEVAQSLWANGQRDKFAQLYGRIARGMIMAQEPGMVQGPALLGGVYSTPMAMVRFLELMVMVADTKAAPGKVSVQTGSASRAVKMGEPIKVNAVSTLKAPAGSMIRVDQPATVNMLASSRNAFATVKLAKRQQTLSEENVLVVELDASRDPLEYYALVAVPSTTFIKQTEDILSDYRGELIYGQQATGSAKMQFIAVPFRGTRTLRLLLEGGVIGTSPGAVVVRHMENVSDVCAVPVPDVAVK